MTVVFLFIGALLCSQFAGIGYKTFSNVSKGYKRITPVFLACWSGFLGVMMAVAATIANRGFHPSKVTVIFALFGGLLFAVASILYVHMMATGPFIWSVMVLNLSNFIPVLYSLAFLGETINPPQIVGIALILSILLVMSIGMRGEGNPITSRWMALATVTMIANGSIVCAQKTQIKLLGGTEALPYITLMFLFASAFAMVYHLLTRDRSERPPYRAFLAPGFCLAGSIGLTNVFFMALMRRVPASIQFPIFTGCGIVLSAIISFALYKERPGWRLYISTALLLAGAILLGM